jgi:hypothetical protein
VDDDVGLDGDRVHLPVMDPEFDSDVAMRRRLAAGPDRDVNLVPRRNSSRATCDPMNPVAPVRQDSHFAMILYN